jgi:hypothetical protein
MRRSHRRVLNAEMDDTTAALLTFLGGTTGQLATMMATAEFWRLHVFGAKGWAKMECVEHIGLFTLATCSVDDELKVATYPVSNMEQSELETFAAAVENGRYATAAVDDAVHGISVWEAIRESASAGRRAGSRRQKRSAPGDAVTGIRRRRQSHIGAERRAWASIHSFAHRFAFFLQQPGGHLERPARELEEGLHAIAADIGAADARVTAAEHQAPDLGFLHAPEAHRTRLERRIERAPGKVERLQLGAGAPDRGDFRMGAGIEVGVDGVLSLADDLAIAHDDRGDGAIAPAQRFASLFERESHVVSMVVSHLLFPLVARA